VQRELSALAGHPGEQEEADERGGTGVECTRGQHVGQAEAAHVHPGHHDAEKEADVADAGHQERLHRGGRRLRQPAVVADQQVRADAHDLPADQQHDEVAGDHDQQHGGREQTDLGGVRAVPVVVGEVRGRVQLDGERDRAHGDRHVRGRGVDPDREVDPDAAEVVAGERPLDETVHCGGQDDGHDERDQRAEDAQQAGDPAGRGGEQQSDERDNERRQRERRGERGRHGVRSRTASAGSTGSGSESGTVSTCTDWRRR
jgi:hypothetical protein